MSTIYLTTQGSVLKKEEHRFLVVKDKQTLLSVPDFRVERILIYGNIQVTTQALKFAMHNNIPITFLTSYGRFVGMALPSFSKNILLRINQFSALNNEETKIKLAKAVLKAKITNSMIMLKRFYKHSEEKFEDTAEFKVFKYRIDTANSIKSLRGIEGGASSVYFNHIKTLISNKVNFAGRSFHPAKDVFSSLLNFLYSLISNEMLGSIYNAGFDPYLGFLHSVEYGRTSLTYDLIEPFRAAVADAIAIKMFRKKMLTQSDFEKHKTYGYILKDSIRKIVLSQYEDKMESKFTLNGKPYNFRILFHEEVDKLKQFVNKKVEFKPFTLKK